jgi:L-ascorbate metabolism protein UlaG (beta-lactamase superfamily)
MERRTGFALAVALLSCGAAWAQRQVSNMNMIPTADGPLVIHPIQHASFVMQWSGKTIYVDPVNGKELFEAYPGPDLILITHDHGDHMSPETVAGVRTGGTTIVAPKAVVEAFPEDQRAGITVLANGSSLSWGPVRIQAVPAYNVTEGRQQFHPPGRGNGYVLELGGKRVYISGDTEDIPEMRALQGIDVAFVCMNLPFTMSVEQAADAVLAFKPKVVFPYHYRSRSEMSDVERFQRLVGQDPGIEVRLLDWYP